MKCVYCKGQTKVTNSRSHNNDLGVWRRRQCIACDALWTTEEKINLSTTHNIKISDSSYKPFSREVLLISIIDSLKHRKDQIEASVALTDTIISKVLSGNSAIISRKELIDVSTETIKAFDKTAGAVYAASHSD